MVNQVYNKVSSYYGTNELSDSDDEVSYFHL